jgi:aryl-alcohol dehydrogenase-like predicted oxidoreductase
MNTITIDNTDVTVSRISFGTASLHNVFSAKHRLQLLCAALDVGITHFDTSPYYGFGLAENDLGYFMRGRRNELTIATKVGLYGPGKAAHNSASVWAKKAFGKLYSSYSKPQIDWSIIRARTSLENSLRRLSSTQVDFLFLHEPDFNIVRSDEFLRWLEDEKSRGSVRCWGLAGIQTAVEPWLRNGHRLASVIQTRDDLVNRWADFVIENGRKLQFTYGYLSYLSKDVSRSPIAKGLVSALERNTTGSIVVSTRRIGRLKKIGTIPIDSTGIHKSC